MKKILTAFLIVFFTSPAWAQSANSRTIGGSILGSIQLADPLPVVDPGIGGSLFFDYRMNDRYSIKLEAFGITQDGTGRSSGEGSIEFLGIPTATFKIHFGHMGAKLDPYAGIGVGFYMLTEGSIDNNTGGFGLGAQMEVGVDYYLADSLSVGVGGTFRSVAIFNSLSGAANATAYMPYTLFGSIGYHF